MKRWLTLLLVAMLMLVISACGGNDDEDSKDGSQDNGEETNENKESSDDKLTVILNDVDGNEATIATLTTVDDGVKIKLDGDGLPEEKAKHAFHIHEKGICEPSDFESAGGHYDPTDKNHGKEDEDADNTVFSEDGTSLVIHDGPDDYKSQPSGDAGDRIVCGIIAEPK